MKSHLRVRHLPLPEPDVPIRWRDATIKPSSDTAVTIRIYSSEITSRLSPIVLHFHGGAFVSGNLDSGMTVALLLASSNVDVISLDYPLAPQHPFPAAVEAGYQVLEWIHTKMGKNPRPLFVAGEEAGGNLAAAVSMIARDRKLVPLCGQILLSPMLDPRLATSSIRKADVGPMGSTWVDGWHLYLSSLASASHPYVTPVAAARLAALPRTLVLTAQDDPMRDEATQYARSLIAAQVPVSLATLTVATGWPDSLMVLTNGRTNWSKEVAARFCTFIGGCLAKNER